MADLESLATMPEGPALSATSDAPVVEPPPPTPEPPPDPPPAEPAEGGDAPPDGEDRTEGEGEAPALTPEAKPRGVAPRMAELTAARKAAEDARQAADARADRLAAQVEKLVELVAAGQAKPATELPAEVPAAEPKPQREEFADPDSYDAALMDWVARTTATQTAARVTAEMERRAADAKAEETRAAQQAATQREQDALAATWQERRAKFIEEHQDFADVAERDDLQIPMTMVPALLMAENGPAVLYHLGQNPSEAARIAALATPVQQAIEIGRISATLATPARGQPSRLPPPITPVGARNDAGPKDPADMTTEEYAAWRMPQLQRERTAGMWGRPARTNGA